MSELKTRMLSLGKSPPYKIQGFQNMHKYEGITEDENLQCIIAGVDMYLMKHQKSKYKLLRMGTIVMRLKDMGAWSALRSMYSYVGDDARTQDTIFRWLFSAGVGSELQGLIEPTQETDKLDSYYPYARAMNLIPSSYASVSNNPNLHLIVHIIGTLRGNMRSGNAKHVLGANEGSARKLGLWIAMGLDFSDDAHMRYRTDETNDQMEEWENTRKQDEGHDRGRPQLEKMEESWIEEESVSVFGSEDGEPEEYIQHLNDFGPTMHELREVNTPELFYQLGVEKKWILPDKVLETYQRRLKSIQYRPGTVGSWLKDMLR